MKQFYKIGLALFALWSIAVCNTFAQSENDFQVRLTKDGNGVIITGYTGPGGKIVIPNTIQGYPVKGIDDDYYSEIFMIPITNITIPNTVEFIGRSVFAYQKYLETVTLPNSLKYIGENCFFECKMLKNINIPNSLQVIKEKAFYTTPNLTTLKLPNGNVKIEQEAFWNSGIKEAVITSKMVFEGKNWFCFCDKLETLIIEEDVKSLPHNFLSSESLRTIKFKSSDTEIFKDTFENLPNLDIASQLELKKHLEKAAAALEKTEREHQQEIEAKFEALKQKLTAEGFSDVERLTCKYPGWENDIPMDFYEEYIVANVPKAKFMKMAKVKKVNDNNIIKFLNNPDNMHNPVYSIDGIDFYIAYSKLNLDSKNRSNRVDTTIRYYNESNNVSNYEAFMLEDEWSGKRSRPFIRKKNSDCVFTLIAKKPFITTKKNR